MKRAVLVSVLTLAVSAGAWCSDTAPASNEFADEEAAQRVTRELSQSLAKLRVEEQALLSAIPLDQSKLTSVREEETLLQNTIVKIALEPLEERAKRFSAIWSPRHPKMVAMRAQIASLKAQLIGEAADK